MLLAEADRLSMLAELVGASAMPGRERVTMLAGRMVREALLQQSALSVVDASCDAARAAALAEAVLAVVDACQALIGAGVGAETIEEQDFLPILRAREDASAAAAVRGCRDAMLARLARLAPAGRPDAGGGTS